jgi:hypothetical protein
MKKLFTIVVLLGVWAVSSAAAQDTSSAGSTDSPTWLGFSLTPTAGLGIGYEKTWDRLSWGVSLGAWSWNTSSGAAETYVNGGTRLSYKLQKWTLSPDVEMSLKAFAALGAYYDSDVAGDEFTVLDGEVGLSLQWLVIHHLSFGLDFGQTLGYGKASDGSSSWISLPLPGLFFGVSF